MAEQPDSPILAAENVVRCYPPRGGAQRGQRRGTTALDGVSIALHRGEILGVVGRSGVGKSTLARVLLGLEQPDSGAVYYGGRRVDTLQSDERRRLHRTVQVVFQDPFSSLDPRQSIGAILAEPLAVHRLSPRAQRGARARDLLRAVGLPGDDEFLRRFPRELSGGERQRVALARALACEPHALILDEPASALDASVRGQVLNLLLDLHRSRGLAMLLIAHDIWLVRRLCNRVAVMADGRIAEEGAVTQVLTTPKSTSAAELVAAARWLSVAPKDKE